MKFTLIATEIVERKRKEAYKECQSGWVKRMLKSLKISRGPPEIYIRNGGVLNNPALVHKHPTVRSPTHAREFQFARLIRFEQVIKPVKSKTKIKHWKIVLKSQEYVVLTLVPPQPTSLSWQ